MDNNIQREFVLCFMSSDTSKVDSSHLFSIVKSVVKYIQSKFKGTCIDENYKHYIEIENCDPLTSIEVTYFAFRGKSYNDCTSDLIAFDDKGGFKSLLDELCKGKQRYINSFFIFFQMRNLN